LAKAPDRDVHEKFCRCRLCGVNADRNRIRTNAVPQRPGAPPSAFDPDPIIQITTTFRARIEGLADPRAVPSPTAQDTARRAVYNMAANECTVLIEIWRAECRLNSLSVYMALVNTGEPGPEPPQFPSMIGTAVFELKPRPSGP
jgi:hypothetical protein